MLNLISLIDKDKGDDRCCCYYCGVDDSESNGSLDAWYREKDYNVAKEKMLNNLKKLRDEIDDLIKREST